jgi:hypothetical protein
MEKNMSKDLSKQKFAHHRSSQISDENESLIAKGKGIWPLIIAVFLVAIYVLISVVMLFISYKVGRL